MNKYDILRQKIQEYAASLAVQAPEDRKWAIHERERGFYIEGDKLDAGAKVKKTISDDLLDILQTIY
jgi:hypothetical protein